MKKNLILVLVLLCYSSAWAAFRSAGTATTAATGVTSMTPGSCAGLAANDIIIVEVSLDAAAASATFASGFTQLYSNSLASPDGQTILVGWKRAVGSDTLTITAMTSIGTKVARAFCWSGRDTTNPPVGSTAATSTASNASPTTITANGVTALSGDDLVWITGLDTSVASASSTFTQPTSYTSQGVSIDTSDNFDTIATATLDNVSAGATGSVAGTLTHSGTAGWAAYLIRIPATGGATPKSAGPVVY